MSVAFPQTGTVDWASLTSMTISAPITLMSRLAQAGVDQYTIELVKFYGQFLNLPSDYLSVVETGLIQARRFGLSADVLYVGAGISLIPPMLAKTRGGVAFAAITMALRVSFPAEFTARVLSEWLRFFERPPEISIPSTSQLQALSNEIAACPIDPEIGRIIWGLERLHENTVGAASSYSRQFTAAPPAQDLAAAIYAITTIRPGQDAIIRFKPPQGPSPVWLAAFASKVLGLGVSYEIGTQVIWEQPQKYCAISGSRGRLRLVTEASLDRSNHTNNYQLLKAASIELNLQRQETNVETSFRISPSLVVDRILGGLFNNLKGKNGAIQCIAKAAYHLSRKYAVWSVRVSDIVQFPFTKNGIKAALLMIGVNPCDLDMLEVEAEAEAEIKGGNIGRDAREIHTFEEDLRDLFGEPFVLLFKKIHVENHQSFSNEQNAWSKNCLDTFQRVLALWTVLAFTSPIGEYSLALDGRAVCRIIERSNGIFSAFQFMWQKLLYDLRGQTVSYAKRMSHLQREHRELQESHFIQISAVHEITFDIIGGRFNSNHSSNINTAGIASGGNFVVMSTLLEPSPQCPKEAAIIFVGQGEIFVNQQAVSFLQSFDPGDTVSRQNLTISPELKTPVTSTLYVDITPMPNPLKTLLRLI